MGCIRQRTPGSWQILFYVNGQQRSKTVRATKRDAERMLREIERAIDLGEYEVKPKKAVMVGDVLRDWLEDVKERREARTYESYESLVRLWLLPELGGFALSDLGPAEIRTIYKKWSQEGQGVTTKHAALSAALGWAVRMELIDRNAAVPAAPPGEPGALKGTLDDGEVHLLLRMAPGKPYGAQAIVALSTGMRRGEISGLRWENVHIGQGILEVREAIANLNGGVIVRKGPKTRSSCRSLALPGVAIEVLANLPSEGEYVFGGKQPVHPAALSSGVSRLCRRLGLNTTLHGLRHTHASLLNRIGGNPLVVQERLGHSSLEQTLGYTHTLTSQHRELAALLDDALRGR